MKPPLGPNPFSGSAPTTTGTGRTAGPTGVTASGQLLLDDAWFAKEASAATAGIAKVKLLGHMELRLSLHAEINKSQLELLNAAKASQIRTFGWPIGLVATREEYGPRPYPDGIRTEISIDQSAMTGRPSYDYWALRSNGDFYLLQSLFEDDRAEKKIFFNTRIVRVTESLMFASKLYSTLGVGPSACRPLTSTIAVTLPSSWWAHAIAASHVEPSSSSPSESRLNTRAGLPRCRRASKLLG